MPSWKLSLLTASLFLGFNPVVQAQSFSSDIDVPPASDVLSVQGLNSKGETSSLPGAQAVEKSSKASSKDKKEDIFIPRYENILDRPTADGSERGTSSIVGIDSKGRRIPMPTKIFLYYQDFRIDRSGSGLTTCDVKFFVNTNLDSRLISLDIKLVWPELTTALSFSDVPPNRPTYYTYTLMGDGCYSMDKMPNIVVNRCRVKGMSSADCASKITWLKAVK